FRYFAGWCDKIQGATIPINQARPNRHAGAVYTLALKTHVGMSIQTFRYFAGWCDKIQGATIPINQARPNR
ncbi:hypothetical protein NPN18_27205, partial [Vibrio parahaemolyticus]|nr:hypothetical protein [Vibrio parahaemolyticus]